MSKDAKKVKKYITNVTELAGFTTSNIVVEHRSNNPKRDYLFVNRVQCKHIPCSPAKFMDMCKKLSDVVYAETHDKYSSILVVGFCETATAIANSVASQLPNCTEITVTTREEINHANSTGLRSSVKNLLNFEEEHSHATTHHISTLSSAEKVFGKHDYILFIDDEVTTGQTILNLKKSLGDKLKGKGLGVASVCNWMAASRKEMFKNEGIDTFSLISGEITDDKVKCDLGNDFTIIPEPEALSNEMGKRWIHIDESNVIPRETFVYERVEHKPNFGSYDSSYMAKLFEAIDSIIESTDKKVRIIGTEEFMYIPIVIGEYIEKKYNIQVVCHSTTRSSIDVTEPNDGDQSNGIRSKAVLHSVYDSTRKTYIYNYDEPVDRVIVVTDTSLNLGFFNDLNCLFGGNTGITKKLNVLTTVLKEIRNNG